MTCIHETATMTNFSVFALQLGFICYLEPHLRTFILLPFSIWNCRGFVNAGDMFDWNLLNQLHWFFISHAKSRTYLNYKLIQKNHPACQPTNGWADALNHILSPCYAFDNSIKMVNYRCYLKSPDLLDSWTLGYRLQPLESCWKILSVGSVICFWFPIKIAKQSIDPWQYPHWTIPSCRHYHNNFISTSTLQ